MARQKPGLRWSIAREHGLEVVALLIGQGAFLLALAGVVVTVYRLYNAFIGG